MRTTGIVGIVAVIAAVVAVGSACSKNAPAAGPKVPSFSTANVPSSAAGVRPVPKSCGAVLTQDEVAEILQVAVTGQTLPIVGVPEPKIGRTARIDCYYGVPTGQDRSAAPVTIGLASYTDETAARKRLDSTVDSEKESGATAGEVPIGPDRGMLLHGKQWTLVAVRGNSTVVITMHLDLVPQDQAGSLIGKLADRALSPR